MLIITYVQPGGQASAAGMKVNDIIVSYDGEGLDTTDSFLQGIRQAKGEHVKVVLLKDEGYGRQISVRVKPGLLGMNAVVLKQKKIDEIKKIRNLILTTTKSIDSYNIKKTIGVIASESIIDMPAYNGIIMRIISIFIDQNNKSQKLLRNARRICIKELKKEALLVNANAVIGVNLNYSEFSGGGKSQLFLVASGTAVRVELI